MGKNKALDSQELADAEAALRWLARRRGEPLAHAIVGFARWVEARGPEALEAALAPVTAPSVSLDHSERAKALKAARAMLAIPGKVWEELGVGFSFNSVSPALSALVRTLEAKPKRRRGRPEGPGRFARRMLAFGAGELGALGLEQLDEDELLAAAVASGVIPGTKGKGKMFDTLWDSWRKHYERHSPLEPATLADAARVRLGAEKIATLRQLFGLSAAA